MLTGKDKRYFDREFKYEMIRLMNEYKPSKIADALEKGFRRRKSEAGLIFHYDRGNQYAS